MNPRSIFIDQDAAPTLRNVLASVDWVLHAPEHAFRTLFPGTKARGACCAPGMVDLVCRYVEAGGNVDDFSGYLKYGARRDDDAHYNAVGLGTSMQSLDKRFPTLTKAARKIRTAEDLSKRGFALAIGWDGQGAVPSFRLWDVGQSESDWQKRFARERYGNSHGWFHEAPMPEFYDWYAGEPVADYEEKRKKRPF